MPGLIDFSVDAAANGVGAPPINFQEGQPAGTVNNSARFLMAALACWREDNVGGLVATRGANNVYSVGTVQGFSQAAANRAHTLAFMVEAANDGPAMLSPDGRTARPLRRPGNIELGPGDLTPDVVYRAAYSVVRSAYIIVAPTIERPGQVQSFATVASIPPGWRRCDGGEVSRSAFAALFGAIGTDYGAGNNSTTFNIPDVNGRGIIGVDNGKNRAVGPGGVDARAIGNVGGSETVTLSAGQMPKHKHGGNTDPNGAQGERQTGSGGEHSHGGQVDNGGTHSHGAESGPTGTHNHGGNTDSNGGHAHDLDYDLLTGIRLGSDGAGTAIGGIGPGRSLRTGVNNSGTHIHGYQTNPAGEHSHGITVANAGDHRHNIPNQPAHSHTIPAVDAHTHSLTTSEAGNGEAHPNMPPSIVMIFAIKV